MKQFGELVFSIEVMKTRLSQNAYAQLVDTITRETPLEKSIAGEIAHSIKEWAIENGATHYTHWFQPLREGTAEKHYAFIDYNEEGELIERLTADQLIQSEPDASSFPSGGIRSTFEARGYTAWDPTSPVFLMEGRQSRTLVIPSVFLSWTGEVLDQKTALLRSKKALNHVAMQIQKLLGNRNAKRIQVWLGIEQEYFLIPKTLYQTRPDLKICGKTLFGASPARGQQFKDHYFGAIKESVLHFMEDVDRELYRKGIPAKTRHNEVSPNQFEITPLFEEVNLAVDHNLQTMTILREVADRHGFAVLLHEKPFNGVNGSGKHVNWSLGDHTGINYLEPSASPLRNITLLATVVSMMLGVQKYGSLLRMAVSDAGNDDRLGGGEAPPNIMSVYLGDYLSSLLGEIESLNRVTEKKMAEISLGIRQLPSVTKDVSDRNRTAPIAFTGNKFEFRFVGSSQNCSETAMIVNLMVTYGYELFYNRLVSLKGDPRANALLVIKELLAQTKAVHFEGNCYSEQWQKEARKRKLPMIAQTPEALECLTHPETIQFFAQAHVLTERELAARQYIKYRKYIKTRQLEIKMALEISRVMVLPALLRQLALIGQALHAIQGAGQAGSQLQKDILQAETLYGDISARIAIMDQRMSQLDLLENVTQVATGYSRLTAEELAILRTLVDKAELIVASDFWPMTTYQNIFSSI